MIKVYDCFWEPYCLRINRRSYKHIINYNKLTNQMIYVENGHFLYNIIGDPEFEWKHKRILYISGYKNKTIINDKYQLASVFSIKDLRKHILSYLDIRYDKKLKKSHNEIATYLNYTKQIKRDFQKYDIVNDLKCIKLLNIIVPENNIMCNCINLILV